MIKTIPRKWNMLNLKVTVHRRQEHQYMLKRGSCCLSRTSVFRPQIIKAENHCYNIVLYFKEKVPLSGRSDKWKSWIPECDHYKSCNNTCHISYLTLALQYHKNTFICPNKTQKLEVLLQTLKTLYVELCLKGGSWLDIWISF